MSNYGIAITTRNRSKWCKALFDSLKGADAAEIVIVNDGPAYDWEPTGENVTYIVNPSQLGIAKSKNIGIKALLNNKGIQYIFTIEDDVVVKNQAVFQKTIDSSLETGLPYFNFPAYSSGAGAPYNRTPTVSIAYKTVTVDFFPNLSAVFSFFTRDILLRGGLYDEDFYNCLIDGEHIYRYSRMQDFPPFWYFPCIANIDDYISIIDGCEHKRQAASSEADWQAMVRKAFFVFKEKHNIEVVNIKKVDINELKERLRIIYARKN